MNSSSSTSTNGQYSLAKTLGIWLLGGAPLWIAGWLVHPALSRGLPIVDSGLLWMKLMLIGLVWQFVLSMAILYREEGDIRIPTIRRRFWLNNPISPKTGQKDNRLWWLLIPLMLLVVALELGIAPFINGIWTNIFPFLVEPQNRSLDALFAPEIQAQLVGAWGFLGLFFINAVFNTILGEEFLFRGVLLPKMKGVFGKWDWVANGALFGMYHFQQPWVAGECLQRGVSVCVSQQALSKHLDGDHRSLRAERAFPVSHAGPGAGTCLE